MKLYVVRHGETDWNKNKRLQGQVDIPLNQLGRTLARKTAKALADIPFEICYTSPLGRAQETARLILEGREVPILDDARLMEISFGDYEGKCFSKNGWNLPQEFHCFFDEPENYKAASRGEDFAQVRERMGAFLRDICAKPQYRDCNILVTTHGAAMSGMMNYIKGEPISRFWGEGVHKNCAVTELQVTEDGIVKIIAENVVYYDDVVEPWEA